MSELTRSTRVCVSRYRGYAESGTRNWYHAGTIRSMDRDGDGRVFRPLAMPQVSEQFRIKPAGPV